MYYENYKNLRDQKGLRDAVIAKNTGIDPSTFSHWSKGLYTPKADKLNRIANYLGVTLEELKAEKKHKENLLTKAFNLFKFS